jgi:hypothetical protein
VLNTGFSATATLTTAPFHGRPSSAVIAVMEIPGYFRFVKSAGDVD